MNFSTRFFCSLLSVSMLVSVPAHAVGFLGKAFWAGVGAGVAHWAHNKVTASNFQQIVAKAGLNGSQTRAVASILLPEQSATLPNVRDMVGDWARGDKSLSQLWVDAKAQAKSYFNTQATKAGAHVAKAKTYLQTVVVPCAKTYTQTQASNFNAWRQEKTPVVKAGLKSVWGNFKSGIVTSYNTARTCAQARIAQYKAAKTVVPSFDEQDVQVAQSLYDGMTPVSTLLAMKPATQTTVVTPVVVEQPVVKTPVVTPTAEAIK